MSKILVMTKNSHLILCVLHVMFSDINFFSCCLFHINSGICLSFKVHILFLDCKVFPKYLSSGTFLLFNFVLQVYTQVLKVGVFLTVFKQNYESVTFSVNNC
jgi:hypothetical protein